ncbi:MAG TPA: hypothetical protein VLF71_03950 [Candidatus Saccharimonadales bacterium]|nr:hypothetical protein [Candidatus Saccharimonadales bacterium]
MKDFIPPEITTLAARHRAIVTVVAEPYDVEDLPGARLADIHIAAPKIAIDVSLIVNTRRGRAYAIDAIKLDGDEFLDQHPDIFLRILDGILAGNVHHKKNWLGHEKMYVTDEDGVKYHPR